MRKSSSYDEMGVRKQFDRIYKLALKGEKIDYCRHIAYRQKHEVMLSELSEKGKCGHEWIATIKSRAIIQVAPTAPIIKSWRDTMTLLLKCRRWRLSGLKRIIP